MSQKAQQVTDLLEPVVAAMGYSLWGVDLLNERGTTLRVYVDSPNGIGADDCQQISRQIGAILDVEETIAGAYVLEVSSPGMTRRFFKPEQMQAYIGKVIQVRLHVGIDGRRKFKGQLLSQDEQSITLQVDDQAVQIPLSDLEKASLDGGF